MSVPPLKFSLLPSDLISSYSSFPILAPSHCPGDAFPELPEQVKVPFYPLSLHHTRPPPYLTYHPFICMLLFLVTVTVTRT